MEVELGLRISHPRGGNYRVCDGRCTHTPCRTHIFLTHFPCVAYIHRVHAWLKVFAVRMSYLSISPSPFSCFIRLPCCSLTVTWRPPSRPWRLHLPCRTVPDPKAQVWRTSGVEFGYLADPTHSHLWAIADGRAVAILHDLLEASDFVAYQKLIDAAVRTEFPLRQLRLLVQLYKAWLPGRSVSRTATGSVAQEPEQASKVPAAKLTQAGCKVAAKKSKVLSNAVSVWERMQVRLAPRSPTACQADQDGPRQVIGSARGGWH